MALVRVERAVAGKAAVAQVAVEKAAVDVMAVAAETVAGWLEGVEVSTAAAMAVAMQVEALVEEWWEAKAATAKMMEEEGGGAMPAVAVGCQSEIHSPRSPCHTRRQKPSIQRRHPHSRRSRSARTSPSR